MRLGRRPAQRLLRTVRLGLMARLLLTSWLPQPQQVLTAYLHPWLSRKPRFTPVAVLQSKVSIVTPRSPYRQADSPLRILIYKQGLSPAYPEALTRLRILSMLAMVGIESLLLHRQELPEPVASLQYQRQTHCFSQAMAHPASSSGALNSN